MIIVTTTHCGLRYANIIKTHSLCPASIPKLRTPISKRDRKKLGQFSCLLPHKMIHQMKREGTQKDKDKDHKYEKTENKKKTFNIPPSK
jgi:hypothetical protein